MAALVGVLALGLLTTPVAGSVAQAAATEGTLYVDTSKLDFGPTPIGSASAPKAVRISNLGGAPVSDLGFEIDAGFTIDRSDCPATLAAGASCTLQVRSEPFARGVTDPAADSLLVLIGPGIAKIIVLRAVTAQDASPLLVTPTDLVFGAVAPGVPIPPQQVKVTNTTSAPVTATIKPDPVAAPYSMSSACGGAGGITLQPGASCAITYSVAPTVRVWNFSYPNIVVKGAIDRSFPITLQGGTETTTGLPVRVTPQHVDFGDVPLGTTSPPQPMVITNVRSTDFTFTVSGLDTSGPFGATTTCGPGAITLVPGASCTVDRTFSPTLIGPFELVDPFTIREDRQLGYSDTIHSGAIGYGRGVGPYLTASRTGVEYPTPAAGATSTQTITVRNDGTGTATDVAVQAPAAPFALASEDCTDLAPGASCTVVYSFTAPASITSTASSVVSSGDSSTTVRLQAPRPPTVPVDAVADAYDGPFGQPLVVGGGAGLFANDTGTSVRSGGTTQPAHGSVVVAADGGFTYTPDAGFTGTDSFSYTLTDLVGATDTATVTIRVGTATSAFVRAAHIDFLDRSPTAAEQVSLDAALGNGATTRRGVVTWLASSDEWLGVIVDGMYRDTLGRAGDPGGTAFWIRQLRTGRRTVAQAAAEFYASTEYFRRVGGTNAAWVADLYPKLLGRPADPGGQAYWVAQTARTGRPRVAARFFQSLESRRGRVTQLYQELLGRGPDPGGREYWAGKIEAQGDIALAIELASSEEYLRRAQQRFP